MVTTSAARRLIILLLLAFAGPGCGGVAETPEPPATKEQYIEQIQTIRRELGKKFVGKQPTGSVQSRVTAELTQVKEGTAEFSERLSKIKPPREARNAHALWIKGLEELAAETQPLIEAVEARSAARYRAGIRNLQSSAAIELIDAQTLFGRLRYPIRTTPSLPPTLRAFRSPALRATVLR